jgi:hypothetical protein
VKSSIIDLFRRARKPGDTRFRKQLYVFLVCLAISVFVWLLASLSKAYVSEVKYHLVYTNVPQDRVLDKEGIEDIHLRIRSRGFDLFSLKYLTIKNPIIVNLEELYIRKDPVSGKSYFLSNQIRQQLVNQLDAADQLLGIRPDTVFFRLDKVVTIIVPVKANLSLQFQKQYQLYDSIKIMPPTVTIRGPESLIDTIERLMTVRKDLEELDQNTDITLALEKPFKNELVSYSADEVELSIPVEEFTEAVIERPLTVQGFNPAQRIKTFPEMVKVKYIVALKDYQRVDPANFKVFASPDTASGQYGSRLRVTRTECPDFVRITSIDPSEMDYIIIE